MKIESNIIFARTRFARDIVAEVAFPVKQTGKVAVLAVGAPSGSSKVDRMLFLARNGYVVVYPRYRGTWESDGFFLDKSPASDIRDVIADLEENRSVVDVATRKSFSVMVRAVHLFGGSFGGPAVLLNTRLPIVKKVIAHSPVIDWSISGEDEPFDEFVRYSCEGYGGAYRVRHKEDWQKLITSDFYNPIAHTNTIDGKKVFVVHALDDTVVPHDPVVPFAIKTGASYYLKPKGGHRLKFEHQFLWKKIQKFLDAK